MNKLIIKIAESQMSKVNKLFLSVIFRDFYFILLKFTLKIRIKQITYSILNLHLPNDF